MERPCLPHTVMLGIVQDSTLGQVVADLLDPKLQKLNSKP